MELFVFVHFHARERQGDAVEQELREVIASSRQETGCLGIHAFRSTRDARLFYIHSKWVDASAFDLHAKMPHTVRFRERVDPLLDLPLDVSRTEMIF